MKSKTLCKQHNLRDAKGRDQGGGVPVHVFLPNRRYIAVQLTVQQIAWIKLQHDEKSKLRYLRSAESSSATIENCMLGKDLCKL